MQEEDSIPKGEPADGLYKAFIDDDPWTLDNCEESAMDGYLNIGKQIQEEAFIKFATEKIIEDEVGHEYAIINEKLNNSTHKFTAMFFQAFRNFSIAKEEKNLGSTS